VRLAFFFCSGKLFIWRGLTFSEGFFVKSTSIYCRINIIVIASPGQTQKLSKDRVNFALCLLRAKRVDIISIAGSRFAIHRSQDFTIFSLRSMQRDKATTNQMTNQMTNMQEYIGTDRAKSTVLSDAIY